MESKEKVCIIIPAYNEDVVIVEVVHGMIKTLKKSKYNSYEIVVVDDASKDNTAQAAQQAGATVISHLLNSGAGGATSTGLRYARKNHFTIAATMDADGQHSPQDVLRGIEMMESKHKPADLLIGSRLVDSKGMSRVKVLGNVGLSVITRLLFGIKVSDSQSGLRIFSRKSIETLTWKTTRYEFCSEMLWRANQLNLMVQEYPIEAIYTDYSKGKGQSNWNAYNIIKNLTLRRLAELFS